MDRFLLIRFSSLGDITLCSAVVRKLAELHPQHECVFLSSAPYQKFIEKYFPHPLLTVIAAPESKMTSMLSYFSFGWKLAKQFAINDQLKSIDGVLDLQGTGKSWAFRWGFSLRSIFYGKAHRIAITPKNSLERWISILWGKNFLKTRYVYREHQGLLSESNSVKTPLLRIKNYVPSENLGSKKILLCPEASRWKKIWPREYWIDLIQRLAKESKPYQMTVVGSENFFSQDQREIISRLETEKIIKNLMGKLKTEDLPEVAVGQDLVLCSNSAWLHIAEAVGCPVISLPGPIVAGFGFSPWRKKSLELTVDNLDCRPCSKHGGGSCRLKGDREQACMTKISPDTVLRNIHEFWSD